MLKKEVIIILNLTSKAVYLQTQIKNTQLWQDQLQTLLS